jgi:hypothetical protein
MTTVKNDTITVNYAVVDVKYATIYAENGDKTWNLIENARKARTYQKFI